MFSGFNALYMSFYTSALYFLWTHTLSLSLPQGFRDDSSSSSQSWIYLTYQAWASWRQLHRLLLVSYFAGSVSKLMERKAWMKMVLGFDSSEMKKTKVLE